MHPQQYQRGRTIAAIATPIGDGAIAVLRISGPEALLVTKKIFSGAIERYESHTAHMGQILNATGSILDHVLLIVFRAPRSYTGEETVEIHCHGGSLITRRVLERILESGAEPALPGEFTFQAFLNGKIDLAQAEAVQLLIASKSELARQSATQQLEGALSQRISQFQQELTAMAAILEAWVDFPEEGLEFATLDEVIASLRSIHQRMCHLLSSFEDGKSIHSGLSLCLLGSPNVGKSSLMNALLGKDRAIVTNIPGTTRDSLEDEMHLGSLHFRLIDTAGIRDSQDPIEQEGIRRSHIAMKRADLVFLILDASRPLTSDDQHLINIVPREKTILIWNKIDLAMPTISIDWEPTVFLSAKQNRNLDELKKAIERKIWKNGPPSKEEVLLTSARHYAALQNAVQSCEDLIHNLESNVSPEFVTMDIRSCLNYLGAIVGTNVSEDILSSIFSQFCVGK